MIGAYGNGAGAGAVVGGFGAGTGAAVGGFGAAAAVAVLGGGVCGLRTRYDSGGPAGTTAQSIAETEVAEVMVWMEMLVTRLAVGSNRRMALPR